MNTYQYSFLAICPIDGDVIRYTLTIEHTKMIRAESIRDVCDNMPGRVMHEDLAAKLKRKLPGAHTLVAEHRGVLIRTTR